MMAGLNKDDVDLHFNTNKFNEDDHAKQISFFYKALYQINDIVLGLIFLVGSFLFFSDNTVFAGTVLFVIGSIQMIIRPLISFIHDLKLSSYYKHKYRNTKKETKHL